MYADADWRTDPNERYSRTSIVCQLGANTVWWKSRKQNSIAVSSCEAEYMALFEGSKDIVWLRNLLCEFGMCQGHIPTLMFFGFDEFEACLRSEHSVLLGGRTLYIGILGAGASHDPTRRRLIPILHYILGYSRSNTNRKS